LAEKLALKKYLQIKLKLLSADLKQLIKDNRSVTMSLSKIEKLLSDPAYIDLLSEHLAKPSLENHFWANADYPKNDKHPENLTHSTVGGLFVRSKSESLIAIALSENNIPFRYENIMSINGIKIAPDFTIMHPLTGKIFLWEHFGLIQNNDYYKEFANKIRVYTEGNFILGNNLIATFESKDSPLNYCTINNIITQYLT